jgi:hypothetical protein
MDDGWMTAQDITSMAPTMSISGQQFDGDRGPMETELSCLLSENGMRRGKTPRFRNLHTLTAMVGPTTSLDDVFPGSNFMHGPMNPCEILSGIIRRNPQLRRVYIVNNLLDHLPPQPLERLAPALRLLKNLNQFDITGQLSISTLVGLGEALHRGTDFRGMHYLPECCRARVRSINGVLAYDTELSFRFLPKDNYRWSMEHGSGSLTSMWAVKIIEVQLALAMGLHQRLGNDSLLRIYLDRDLMCMILQQMFEAGDLTSR